MSDYWTRQQDYREQIEDSAREQWSELYCEGCAAYIDSVREWRDGYCGGCWACPCDHDDDEPCEDIHGNKLLGVA